MAVRPEQDRSCPQVEGDLDAEDCGAPDRARVAALEPAPLLHARAQERLSRRRPPPFQLLGGPAGPDRSHGVGDRCVAGGGVVNVVRHHRRQPQLTGQLVELVVDHVVEGLAVVDQLDGDVAAAEPVDQPRQLGPRRGQAVIGECAADRAFAAAREDDDVPGQLVDHLFEAVDRAAFLAAVDLGVGDDGQSRW